MCMSVMSHGINLRSLMLDILRTTTNKKNMATAVERGHTLSTWVHSWPHYNVTWDSVNSDFKPANLNYVQSLGMLGSFAFIGLLCTLIALLIYYLTRIWSEDRSPCLIAIKGEFNTVATVCLVTAFVGLLATITFYFAVLKFVNQCYRIDRIAQQIISEGKAVEDSMYNTIDECYEGIKYTEKEAKKITDKDKSNRTVSEVIASIDGLKVMSERINLIMNVAGNVEEGNKEYIKSVDNARVRDYAHRLWAWVAAGCIGWATGWLTIIVICVSFIVAIYLRSQAVMRVLQILTFCAQTASWIGMSAMIILSVIVADICDNPAEAIAANLEFKFMPKGKNNTETVLYYLECNVSYEKASLDKPVNVQNDLDSMRENLDYLMASKRDVKDDKYISEYKQGFQNISDALFKGEVAVVNIKDLIGCNMTKAYFRKGMDNVCTAGLKALLLQMIIALLVALLLTGILFRFISTKRSTRKRKCIDPDCRTFICSCRDRKKRMSVSFSESHNGD